MDIVSAVQCGAASLRNKRMSVRHRQALHTYTVCVSFELGYGKIAARGLMLES